MAASKTFGLFVSALAIVAAVPAVARSADIAGTWQALARAPNGSPDTVTLTFLFSRKGGKLLGSMQGPMGKVALEDVKETAGKVTFKMSTPMGGSIAGSAQIVKNVLKIKMPGPDGRPAELMAKRIVK
ncbi:MAG: hypothetical protein IBJ12_02675 [Sphingomonadaceae bacterium]|nr:hypothetical protein [Sphingomonadaceae bacterium]